MRLFEIIDNFWFLNDYFWYANIKSIKMNTTLIRKTIKMFREQYPLTIEQMANKCSMSDRNYLRIENGETKNLSIELLNNIAEALDISIFDLIPQESITIENVNQQIGGKNNTHIIVNKAQADLKETLDLLLEQQRVALKLFAETITALQKQIIDRYFVKPSKEK
jgi:transcriptional regulator with XRE-family HTH domain